MPERNSIEAAKKALGEPIFAELTDNAWKIRTNLMLTSIIAIGMVVGGLQIEPDSQIIGLKFKGLSNELLYQGLTVIVGYLFAHFLWASLDALAIWRVRITGTRLVFQTAATFASEHGDYPKDPKQSTLYSWWLQEATRIGNVSEPLSAIQTKLAAYEDELRRRFTDRSDALNIANATAQLAQLQSEINSIQRNLEATKSVIASARIPASLERFDDWFQLMLRGQNLRWLIIDFAAPIFTAALALSLLGGRLFAT